MGCGSSAGYHNLGDLRSMPSNSGNPKEKKPETLSNNDRVLETVAFTSESQQTENMYSSTYKQENEKPKSDEGKCDNMLEGEGHLQKRCSRRVTNWQTTNVEELLESLNINSIDDSVKWWDLVDHFMVKTEPVIQPQTKRKTWKTVRLFISSTFKDMSSERECLVKSVVPSLRHWCAERKIRLVECDLRWGVPKDSDTRETLMACLSEIDRCREENEYPYFLNMLSERYGSVMKPEDVPEDIKLRYKWLPGMSVTGLEVFTGAYWDRNPNALFMMRQDCFLNGVTDENIRKIYTESDPSAVESLKILKGKIREKYRSQTFDYSCHVETVENGKLVLGGLQDFAKQVYNHFKACIEKQYPADCINQEMTETETLRAEQEDFLTLRSQGLVGRDETLKQVLMYIDSQERSTSPMTLVGSAGAGKSSLLASSAKMSLENEKYKVFFHFVGATPDSTSLYSVLSRLFNECMPDNATHIIDPDEMMRYTKTMLVKASEHAQSQGYEKLVIYIDALNQIDNDGMAHKLAWLPRQLPQGVRLIVSTLEGDVLHALRSHDVKCHEVLIEPLNKVYRTNIVAEYLAEYNKLLDDEQMDLLVSKEDSGRPLYLTIACEELRVFGEFRKLTDKVRGLPAELTGVIEIVLKRIIDEYGGDCVLSTLCLIETSRFGLMEEELLELLAVEPVIPNKNPNSVVTFTGEQIHMAKWAYVYLGLHQFLRPCGGSGEGRLDFYHRTSSKVVRQVFLVDDETILSYHKRLAAYFSQCKDVARKCQELPYHLMATHDKTKLHALLLERDVFEHLSMEKHKQQLMQNWQFLGGYEPAAKAYTQFLEDYITTHNLADSEEGLRLQMRVGWFLVDIGQYDTVLTLLFKVIEDTKKKYGDEAKQLADPLHALMTAIFRKALSYVYNSHPGYQQSRKYGETYGPQCEKIHRLHWPADSDHLGRVLTQCAYFNGRLLQNCLEIFEKTKNMRGKAEVLYMLGEKEQYSHDITVPERKFEQALALCLASYGRLHLQTARCYQLYGQLYWNQWSSISRRTDWLEKCLSLYKVEVEILEEVQGKLHPNTVRSREDVIIILQSLNRNREAEEYNKDQPAHAKTTCIA